MDNDGQERSYSQFSPTINVVSDLEDLKTVLPILWHLNSMKASVFNLMAKGRVPLKKGKFPTSDLPRKCWFAVFDWMEVRHITEARGGVVTVAGC